jgi:hypothetical protein
VYDIVEFLTENISTWQIEYTDEEARIENTNKSNINEDPEDASEDEIDFYTTTFTAEERKKLSRRQRQKLRAAEKSHARDEVLLEKQRQKEMKDEERRARIRTEDSTIMARRAEQVVEQRWREWVEDEAEKAARRAMNDAFLREEGREKAREAADIARKEVLRFHGELDVGSGDEAAEPKQDINKVEKEVAVPLTDRRAREPMIEDDTTPIETAQPTSTTNSGATAKTLAFTEKLRRMYEQKVKEKAAGISVDKDSALGTIRLADAIDEAPSKTTEPTAHVPTPIVTPSPCNEHILEDILSTQREQPWLVQPDARVPIQSSRTIAKEDMSTKKEKLNNTLRLELERKYSSKSQIRYGKGKGKGQQRLSQFDEMLSSRSKLPAYKMRDQILQTIRNVSLGSFHF